eukprot:357241-Chlamydomonas_euryale.AAC.7
MDVRNVRALAAFHHLQDIRTSHKLSNKQKWVCTRPEVQMGRLEATHPNCLRRIVGVKLTYRHRLVTMREQCGTSSLELLVRKWTHQWMGADG